MRDHISELANIEKHRTADELYSRLAILGVESERLFTALKNLTDNPGIEVGQLLISTRPESLVELVNSSISSFRSAASAAQVQLSVKILSSLPEVQIDRYRIEQVLNNLLDNAIRFTPPLGRVVLTADCIPNNPDYVTVSVIDTGSGIHPDNLATLFNAKARNGSADSVAEQGMGLGLRICKEIIHSHKGEISARSLPEAGTTVTFTLPLDSDGRSKSTVWNHVKTIEVVPRWSMEV
jgi:signal transduction histidine kinase